MKKKRTHTNKFSDGYNVRVRGGMTQRERPTERNALK